MLEFMDLTWPGTQNFSLSRACDKLNMKGEYKNVKNNESFKNNHVCGL